MHLYAHHKYNGCIIWHLILFGSNAYFVSITLHTQQHNMWKDTLPNFWLFLGLTRLHSNSQNFPEGGRGKGGESGHPDKFRVPCNSVSKACYVKVVLFYILSYSKFLSFSQTVRLVKDVSGYRRCVGRDVLAREIRTANTQAHTHKYNT